LINKNTISVSYYANSST